MSHAMVNVDVTENAPTVKPSPFSASVGLWIDGDTSLHFRDAGHLGKWLAAACVGLAALLDPWIETYDPAAVRDHKAKGGTVKHKPAKTDRWVECRCARLSEECANGIVHRLLPIDDPPTDLLGFRCVGSELPEAQEPVG
jgi:hypothetical protein